MGLTTACKLFPQGSREARQPWAVFRNRFAVMLCRTRTCSELLLVTFSVDVKVPLANIDGIAKVAARVRTFEAYGDLLNSYADYLLSRDYEVRWGQLSLVNLGQRCRRIAARATIIVERSHDGGG